MKLGLVSQKLGPVFCAVIATFKHIRNCNCSLLVFTDQKLKFFSYKSHLLPTKKQQQEPKVQNMKTFTLTFPSRSIKSELMVATTVHTAYKTLVWNVEHKKTISTENNSYVPSNVYLQ